MVSGEYSPQGFIHQSLKDFRLILDQAASRGQEMPLAALNAAVLEACVKRGEGERDNSAVIEEIRRRKTLSGQRWAAAIRLDSVRPLPDAETRSAGRGDMRRSEKRILTTHTGSLPRPLELTRLYAQRARGEPVDAAELAAAGQAPR